METFKVGDVVHHEPTGEEWVVALCEEGKVYWCGYPFGGYGLEEDCSLVEDANQESSHKLIELLASGKGSELPRIRARENL